MSKAARFKQQQKEAKLAKQGKTNQPKVAEPIQQKTLKERQAENKEALRKHQASMQKLKQFEDKLHPKPEGAQAAAPEKSALDSMFYDGGNLNKDQGRTSHVVAHAPPVAHEKNTAIKPTV